MQSKSGKEYIPCKGGGGFSLYIGFGTFTNIGAISSKGPADLDIIIILQEFSNLIAYFLGNICVS